MQRASRKSLIIGALLFCGTLSSGCRTVTLGWRISEEEPADVFVNGQWIGRTPVEIEFEKLKRRVHLEPKPPEDIPRGMGSSVLFNLDSGYAIKAGCIRAEPHEGNDTNIILLQETKDEKTQNWLLFVKVTAPDGRVGVNNGGGSRMTQTWFRERVAKSWHFRMVRPKPGG